MRPSDTERVTAQLRWYWHEAAGELGMRSNFPAFVARMEGRGTSSPQQQGVDGRSFAAATRHRTIARALERMDPSLVVVLLELLRLQGDGMIRVSMLAPEAWQRYLASRTKRKFDDWVHRLWSSAGGQSLDNRRVFCEIRDSAEALVRQAVSAFVRSGGLRSAHNPGRSTPFESSPE